MSHGVAPELKRKAKDLLAAGIGPKRVKQAFLDDPAIHKDRVPSTEKLRTMKQCMVTKDQKILGDLSNRELIVYFNQFKVCCVIILSYTEYSTMDDFE